MRGITFEDRSAEVARSPYRADVALFVGFVARRRRVHDRPDAADHPRPDDAELAYRVIPTDVDEGDPALYRWLVTEGWARGDATADAPLEALRDVPVPIDRLELFDRLFAGRHRPWIGGRTVDTYLRAAVRSFFAQGGRLCYVVRVDDPWPLPTTPAEAPAMIAARSTRLELLIPGFADPARTGSSVDRRTWRGIWVLHGLPDVSYAALPDLPDIVRAAVPEERPFPPPPPIEAGFVECSEPVGVPEDLTRLHGTAGPRCDEAGYALWADAVGRVVREVAEPRPTSTLREVQVIAPVPRPVDDRVAADLRGALAGVGLDTKVSEGGLASAFLQLVYPWLRTTGSTRLAEGLETPDGVLAGVLARHALERGSFRSAEGRRVYGVIAAVPRLSGRDTADVADPDRLGGRVSLIGPAPGTFRVLSDVTTSREIYRSAHLGRLMAAVVRSLRVIGESIAFGPNGPQTWSAVRQRARDLLRGFWQAGALHGSREEDAFTVRCDRTTMTQDDLDAGRLIAHVELAAASAIQRIHVVLTRTGQGVALERAA
jgi:hypothetical protein